MKKYIVLSFFFILILAFPCYANQLDERQIKPNTFTTPAQVNQLIADATASIQINQTITLPAAENLSAGDIVSILNDGGTMKAYNIPLTVSTSPNGSEYVFNSAATTYCSAVALDSSRFLVAYVDSDNYPKAIVGTVTGSTIAWGSESAAFESNPAANTTAAKIDTDKVLVCFGANSRVASVVLTISNNSISKGTVVDIDTVATVYQHSTMSVLETNKVITCYYAGGFGYSKIITIESTTPTPYPSASVAGIKYNGEDTAIYNSVSALSSTSAIVAYRDGGNSNYGTAQVLSISGTTITPGTEYLYYGNKATAYCSVCAASSTTAIITFADSAIDGYGRAVHVTNSSGTLTFGTVLGPSSNNNNQWMSVVKIDNTHFLWSFAKADVSTNAYSCVLTLSGTTLTAGTFYSFNPINSTFITSCYLGSNKSVICYRDTGNSDYGTAVVNQWATSSYASVSGISQGAYSSGSDAVVLIHGTDDNQSGLITGEEYYVQSDFTLATTETALDGNYIKMGIAKSSSEIVLE